MEIPPEIKAQFSSDHPKRYTAEELIKLGVQPEVAGVVSQFVVTDPRSFQFTFGDMRVSVVIQPPRWDEMPWTARIEVTYPSGEREVAEEATPIPTINPDLPDVRVLEAVFRPLLESSRRRLQCERTRASVMLLFNRLAPGSTILLAQETVEALADGRATVGVTQAAGGLTVTLAVTFVDGLTTAADFGL